MPKNIKSLVEILKNFFQQNNSKLYRTLNFLVSLLINSSLISKIEAIRLYDLVMSIKIWSLILKFYKTRISLKGT
jgi:hypothetical protein